RSRWLKLAQRHRPLFERAVGVLGLENFEDVLAGYGDFESPLWHIPEFGFSHQLYQFSWLRLLCFLNVVHKNAVADVSGFARPGHLKRDEFAVVAHDWVGRLVAMWDVWIQFILGGRQRWKTPSASLTSETP